MIKEPSFWERRAVGDAAKAIVRCLLESAGYRVYPFGYESFVTHIKDLAHLKKLVPTTTVRQTRKMPDFFVVDEEGLLVGEPVEEKYGVVEFVEIKYRSTPIDKINSGDVVEEDLKKFWPESLLILVVPFDYVFYALSIPSLEQSKTMKVRILKPMKFKPSMLEKTPPDTVVPIRAFFPRISEDVLKRFQEIVKKMFSPEVLRWKIL
jgi:hypothetical protein